MKNESATQCYKEVTAQATEKTKINSWKNTFT